MHGGVHVDSDGGLPLSLLQKQDCNPNKVMVKQDRTLDTLARSCSPLACLHLRENQDRAGRCWNASRHARRGVCRGSCSRAGPSAWPRSVLEIVFRCREIFLSANTAATTEPLEPAFRFLGCPGMGHARLRTPEL